MHESAGAGGSGAAHANSNSDFQTKRTLDRISSWISLLDPSVWMYMRKRTPFSLSSHELTSIASSASPFSFTGSSLILLLPVLWIPRFGECKQTRVAKKESTCTITRLFGVLSFAGEKKQHSLAGENTSEYNDVARRPLVLHTTHTPGKEDDAREIRVAGNSSSARILMSGQKKKISETPAQKGSPSKQTTSRKGETRSRGRRPLIDENPASSSRG